jgi:hypothetical protein
MMALSHKLGQCIVEFDCSSPQVAASVAGGWLPDTIDAWRDTRTGRGKLSTFAEKSERKKFAQAIVVGG